MKTNLLPICSERILLSYRKLLLTLLSFSILVFLNLSCKDNNRVHPDPVELTWDFNPGQEGWSGDFAEYPAGGETLYELLFEHDTLPLPLDQSQKALKLTGNNANSDLFMFAKKKITSLDPNTVYFATFSVEFASNMADTVNSRLIHVAAGATPVEPMKIIGENNIYEMNIEKCNEGQDGEDMVIMGNFSNNTGQQVYVLKTVENEQPFHCVTNENGELWVIVGIDSGYASTTTVYINSVMVELF